MMRNIIVNKLILLGLTTCMSPVIGGGGASKNKRVKELYTVIPSGSQATLNSASQVVQPNEIVPEIPNLSPEIARKKFLSWVYNSLDSGIVAEWNYDDVKKNISQIPQEVVAEALLFIHADRDRHQKFVMETTFLISNMDVIYLIEYKNGALLDALNWKHIHQIFSKAIAQTKSINRLPQRTFDRIVRASRYADDDFYPFIHEFIDCIVDGPYDCEDFLHNLICNTGCFVDRHEFCLKCIQRLEKNKLLNLRFYIKFLSLLQERYSSYCHSGSNSVRRAFFTLFDYVKNLINTHCRVIDPINLELEIEFQMSRLSLDTSMTFDEFMSFKTSIQDVCHLFKQITLDILLHLIFALRDKGLNDEFLHELQNSSEENFALWTELKKKC